MGYRLRQDCGSRPAFPSAQPRSASSFAQTVALSDCDPFGSVRGVNVLFSVASDTRHPITDVTISALSDN
jgi:hypothetical protein